MTITKAIQSGFTSEELIKNFRYKMQDGRIVELTEQDILNLIRDFTKVILDKKPSEFKNWCVEVDKHYTKCGE